MCVCWGVDICVRVQAPTEVTDPLKQQVQAAVSHLVTCNGFWELSLSTLTEQQWLLRAKPSL